MSFVHLHLHTQYSLLDGANKIKEVLPRVKAAGMPACAITDHGNMFGAVQFYHEAVRVGVKPIIGCEMYVAPKSRFDKEGRIDDYEAGGNYHLILLAMNRDGYRNLCRLVSAGYQEGFHYKPRVDKALLRELNGGIIALSGCLRGEIAHSLMVGQKAKAFTAAEELGSIFRDRFYLELQDNHLDKQEAVNAELIDLARKTGLPLVGTNDCHYLACEDSAAHEALLCIQTGKTFSDAKRWKFETDQLFVKDPQQMAAAFAHVPGAISTTLDIAARCDFEFKQTFQFPAYAVPRGDTLESALERDARRGLDDRLNGRRVLTAPVAAEGSYDARLRYELGVINQMGFAGYFLIVADFINWAKNQGIPVGPGRGSAAGSLVAWALRITDLDPIEHGLLFERFLNPERRSMPDIDVDFCFVRRDEVIRYVKEKYGEDRVAQIITFGTLKGKQAIKDVGRVLDFTFAETDRITKLYPEPKQGKDFPLAKALEMEPKLVEIQQSGDRERRLFDLALRLEGLLRNCSKHAAGIVISPRPLSEDLPLWIDKDGAVVTQYTFTDVEAIGLIKFDFLGLKNLTLIETIVRLIGESRGTTINLEELPFDDAPTYKVLQDADTIGVFQAESGGMRRMLAQLRPSCFADVVAALALYRPGPLDSGMVDEFIKRKHGREPIKYLHLALEPILRDTYGVIVYQEQVMQIAQALAGYSLGDADNLRRAMGKKKAEEMAMERKRFLEGVARQGTATRELAAQIFDQMETFAAYGFNKSHSAAYAVITYQTAFLKAHYRVEFMAGLLSLEAGDADNTFKNIAECREHGIAILPPDVNESREDFTVVGTAIRFGLGAVKGIGSKAIEAIIAARGDGERFVSLHDFCVRVRGQVVNRKVLESLIACGAFDSMERNRARLWGALDDVLKWANLCVEERTSPQLGLFAGAGGAGSFAVPPPLPECAPWKAEEELRHEREAIGFFITGHPLDRYLKDLRKFTNVTVGTLRTRGVELPPLPQNGPARPGREPRPRVRIGGVINSIRLRNSKKGDRYATFMLEDKEGTVEVIAWPDTYQRHGSTITAGEAVVIGGGLDVSPERCQIIADEIMPLTEARAGAIRQVHVNVPLARIDRDGLHRLRETLAAHPGTCEAFLHLLRPDGSETIVAVPTSIRVAATDDVVEAVERVIGSGMLSFR